MYLILIGILLIDISNVYRYRYIYPVSLYLFCQIYLEDTFRKNLECSSEMSLTVISNEVLWTQIFSTGRMSEIVRSDKPCRIEFRAHLSISGPIRCDNPSWWWRFELKNHGWKLKICVTLITILCYLEAKFGYSYFIIYFA